jgi:hypothetical protein
MVAALGVTVISTLISAFCPPQPMSKEMIIRLVNEGQFLLWLIVKY